MCAHCAGVVGAPVIVKEISTTELKLMCVAIAFTAVWSNKVGLHLELNIAV